MHVFGLLGKSSERRIELAAKRHAEEDLEDDDLSEIEDDEETVTNHQPQITNPRWKG